LVLVPRCGAQIAEQNVVRIPVRTRSGSRPESDQDRVLSVCGDVLRSDNRAASPVSCSLLLQV